MKKASSKAYVSKRKLERYQEERLKRLERLKNGETIPEDEDYKSSGDEQQVAASQEEVKQPQQMIQSKKQSRGRQASTEKKFYRPRAASLCDYASDEEVDDEELGDDIAGTRAQQVQPQQFIQALQPQQQMLQLQPQQQIQMQQQPQQRLQMRNASLGSAGSESEEDVQMPQQDLQQQQIIQQLQQQQEPQKEGFFKKIIGSIFGGAKENQKKKQNKKVQGPSYRPQQNSIGMGRAPVANMSLQQPQQVPATGERFRQKVDTNVFQISMSCLKEQTYELATGDPNYCKSCSAILNIFSVIETQASEEDAAQQQQVWNCEFCNHKNIVNIEPEELPKGGTVSYILEAAPVKSQDQEESKTSTAPEVAKDISVVYCIDVSGSMAGARLKAVQATILGQIKEMKDTNPDRKVGIVTFTDYVDVIGDGTAEMVRIGQEHLNNYEYMMKQAVTNSTVCLSKPLGSTHDNLAKKVRELKALGSTAMGPGLLVSIGLAGEGAPGSQVIVCTDGASNMGLNDAATYSRLGEYAQGKGVTVHIVTFQGTECNIDSISTVSQMTNGEIERVNPNDLGSNFREFLAKPVLATQVQLKVKLHLGLEFRNEMVQNLSNQNTILTKDFGNVNEDTDICFEYQVKPLRELLKLAHIDFSTLSHLPFQAQIHYSALDGSRQVRVITDRLEISTDKEDLKKNADFQILGINAIQQSSKLARVGEYKQAQAVAKAWDKVMTRDAPALNVEQQEQVYNFRSNIGETYNLMYQQQQMPAQKASDMVSQNIYQAARINKTKWNKKISK